MYTHSRQKSSRWVRVGRVLLVLIMFWVLAAGLAGAQGGTIVLDGAGDDWDPSWLIATDPLDVFLTDTGVHPHEPPTYARTGYDAVGLWARYQDGDGRWYFRIDVDGRAADSDSQIGTANNLGVGTHDFDEGPLVVPPFEDGQGLGNSEAYKIGLQFEAGGSGPTSELGPGTAILPGVVSSTTAGLDGLGVYSTTVPGVVEFSIDRALIFPDGSARNQLWVSAQVGDNNDRVSDDQVAATLVVAVDLAAGCPAAPIVAGDQATFPVDYAVPAAAAQSIRDVMLAVGVPAGTTFVSASGGGTEAGGVISWDLGELGPGDAGQVTFTIQVGASLASVEVGSEIASVEGLRYQSQNVCPAQEPTATPTATPTSTATPTVTPSPTVTPPSEEPPVVPEASTTLLLLAGAGSLAGYAALQWRARRRP